MQQDIYQSYKGDKNRTRGKPLFGHEEFILIPVSYLSNYTGPFQLEEMVDW